MQSFKFEFLENQNWTDWGVSFIYVYVSISRTLHNFSKGFFSMYRGILELKNDASNLRKNGLFANKTRCVLTALFVKAKFYFFRCNFGNKQINKIPGILFSYRLYSICRTQNIPENVCNFGNGTLNQWAPTKNLPVLYDKLLNFF